MKISIVTACFNSERTIERTLRSVMCQKGAFEREHLIQDGGSSDGTIDLIRNYELGIKNSRHSVSMRSESDAGFYDAINKGIARASGDIIGLINADDWLADDHVLASVASLFESDPGLDVVYADLDYVELAEAHSFVPEILRDSRAKPMPFAHKVKRHWVAGSTSRSKFRNGWMPPHPTVYARREVFEQLGGYRLDMGSAADYEWIVRVFAKAGARTAYLPRVTVKMLVGGQSNESLGARLRANRMDRRAWTVNGLKPRPWFAIAKPLRKWDQFLGKWSVKHSEE